MSTNIRYVAKAEAGVGWRVFDRNTKRWWGNFFSYYPQMLLDELNGEKRPDKLVELCRNAFAAK